MNQKFHVLKEKELTMLKGGASYAVYNDGQFCCFVEGTKEDAEAFAKAQYGDSAYVMRYN